MNHSDPITAVLLLSIMLIAYFLPWIIAAGRDHHQRSAILLLNLLLGWTILGWIAAIVWSATAIPVKETTHA